MATSTLQPDGSQTLTAPTAQIVNPIYQPGSVGPGNTPYLNTPIPLAGPAAPPTSANINPAIIGNVQPLTFPPAPSAATTASTAIANNASIPSTIPTAESIINQSTVQTPAEQLNQRLLNSVASLTGSEQTQQRLTLDAENAAGVPGLTKVTNDLNTQLQGLNDQATALQNDANYTIPNQVQLDNQGSGVTKASTTARSADALRINQIKQGQIASQALTVKSALFGAQGNLSLAKDAADKAADAQYADQEQQIKYQQALIAANAPQMDKEQKAQAAIVQAKLQDRQNQIDQAKDDKKSIIALATAAIANNPNDPAAQYAAQQALALSNKEQPDLQAAIALVGKYQSDLVKRSLDEQVARANINQSNAAADKSRYELSQEKNPGGANYNGEFAATLQLASNANTTAPAVTKANTLRQLQGYIANKDYKSAYQTIVQQTGAALKGTDANNFQNAVKLNSTLGDLKNALQAYSDAGGNTNVLTGTQDQIQTKLGTLLTDPKYASLAVQLDTAYQSYRQALTGANFSSAEAASYASVLPSKSNTLSLNLAKIAGAQAAANSAINGGIMAAGIGQGGIEIKNKAENPTSPTISDTPDPQSVKVGSTVTINGVKYLKSGSDSYDPI